MPERLLNSGDQREINEIIEQLKSLYPSEGEEENTRPALAQAREIVRIMRNLIKSVVHTNEEEGKKNELGIRFQKVDYPGKRPTDQLEELILSMTTTTKKQRFDVPGLRWLTRKIIKETLLVLTPNGYRETVPRRLDSKRFTTKWNSSNPRLTPYSNNSHMLKKFIDEFHSILKKVYPTKDPTPHAKSQSRP